MIRKIYAAVVIAMALSLALEIASGYEAAIFSPRELYSLTGNQPGFWAVAIVTVAAPAFLVSLLLMPALKFQVGSEVVKYSAVVAVVTLGIMLYRSDGWMSSWMNARVFVPNLVGAGAVIAAAFVYTKLRSVQF